MANEDLLLRQMPHSLEGEQAVLGLSLIHILTEDAVGQSASAPIILSSDNYADSTADVVVNVVYEFVPVLDVEDISAVYDGEPIADTAIRGTAVYDGQTVEGTWAFKAGQNLTAVADSGPKTVAVSYTHLPGGHDHRRPAADRRGHRPGRGPFEERGRGGADLCPAGGTQ